jgi:hypothetical protein
VAVDPEERASEIAEVVEEIRFYLEHFMRDQAQAAFARLKSLTDDRSIVDAVRLQIEAARSKGAAEAEPEVSEVAEINADEPNDFDIEVESAASSELAIPQEPLVGYDHEMPAIQEAAAEAEVEPVVEEAEVVEAEESDDLSSFVSDLEKSLGDGFPTVEEKPAAPATKQPMAAWPQTAPAQPKPVPPAVSAPPVQRIPVPKPAPVVAAEIPSARKIAAQEIAAPAASAAAAGAGSPLSYSQTPVRPLGAGATAMHPQDSVDLSQMFGELKHELEEGSTNVEDGDPETHYNLGVAFREMGLLDEAIAELQKVCSSIERGHEFSQIVQTYTWLAQCFIDKGVPDAAIRWFEKALTIPGLDQEAKLAIHYELGSACEHAQDKAAALRHFTAVYGGNIDYRDVAERIQALKS